MRRKPTLSRWLIVGVLLVLGACERDAPTALPVDQERDPATAEFDLGDRLARAFASAMQDNQFRIGVLQDLRDSPFKRHRIHLQSYLQHNDEIRHQLEDRMDIRPGSLLRLLQTVPVLELSIRRARDRIGWRGEADILVAGTSGAVAERVALGPWYAYAPSGDSVLIEFSPSFSPIVLSVLPTDVWFGESPEEMRRAAPKWSRHAVSTREDEFVNPPMTVISSGGSIGPQTSPTSPLTVDECDEFSFVCDDNPDVNDGSGIGFDPPYDWASCTPPGLMGPDRDQDGFADECELVWARAFSPLARTQRRDAAPTKEPYFAMGPYGTHGQIRFFFAFAYHRDTGTPNFGLFSHEGDSEFAVVKVLKHGKFKVTAVYYSAHYGKPLVDSSEWYNEPELSYADVYRGRPIAWVSRDKHANYESRSHCNWGALSADGCSSSYKNLYLSLPNGSNLGSRSNRLVNCTRSRGGYPGRECFWNFMDSFTGWLGAPVGESSDGARPYYFMLRDFGF
ncbi:MAG: hypothetical protein KAJ42_05310 [Gemmatimonadetes bacterium]|nr:hypothetical protein [Gemmatimonadota bacterium]